MDIETLAFRATDLRTRVLPLLRSAAFHVTTARALEGICSSGAIKPNTDGALGGSPNYAHALSRYRNYVAICDLRHVSDEDLDHALQAYYFLNPITRGADVAFLFLGPVALANLVSWQQLRDELPHGKLLVPYIEAAYPDALELALIERILLVNIEHAPPDALLAAHETLSRRPPAV